MEIIAKVAVAAATYAIDRPYDYRVPPELTRSLKPGMRVAVPFGAGNRVSDGIVLACVPQETMPDQKLKFLIAQLDDEPMFDSEFIQLALWMRDRYFCTVYDAARVMLPAGLWYALKDCWKLAPGIDREKAFEAAGQSEKMIRLIDLILANNGWIEIGQIRLAFGTAEVNSVLRSLEEKGILLKESSVSRGIGEKTEQIAALAVGPEDALAYVTPKRRRAPLQYNVIETLCVAGQASTKELCYFTGASMSTIRALEKAGLIILSKREVYRRPIVPSNEFLVDPELNEEQDRAWERLRALKQQHKASAALLYGVTGSGKTLVYIKMIQEVLRSGQSAIILVPEIALTPQLSELFLGYFGDRVALLHSSLSAGERYDEWKRIRKGEATVVIGTRSAVFAPVKDLGVVIVDEEQESSYKSDQTPRYHAREIAKYRCVKANALLVLGSATPTIETMYHAKSGQYHFISMTHRYNDQALPQVEIVDMRQMLREGGGRCISAPLQCAIDETLSREEQVILFLNRRGAHHMVICGECGEVPECPRCSVKLNYHSANQRLMCHYCGYSRAMPECCPTCGGILSFSGVGIQKAEEELRSIFPETEILRMDTDTVNAKNTHETILNRFRNEKVPLLLGTQMVAKGLDFKNVTLVGVLSADQMLYSEDYRAGERVFSLLTQVVGRAGRGEKSGRAMIQSYTPDNDVIRFASAQDYDSFYEQEIRIRKVRNQPPFMDILVIRATGLEETAVLRSCMNLRETIKYALSQRQYSDYHFQIFGPAPALITKVNHRYRYSLTVKIKNTKEIRQLVAHLLRQAMRDKQNRGVSMFADFDAMD